MTSSFPVEVNRVKLWLESRGFTPRIKLLGVTAKTARDAATAVGCDLEKIAKSLVFYIVATQKPILIIVSGKNRVDKTKVGEYLGQKIKTAGPDFVLHVTGFSAGGVPPVAHLQPIRTLIDQDLLSFAAIWVAAGHPNALFPLSPAVVAAKGVDFRVPLNPDAPAEPQDTVFPPASVTVTRVLLNVAVMYTFPFTPILFSFCLLSLFLCFGSLYLSQSLFL